MRRKMEKKDEWYKRKKIKMLEKSIEFDKENIKANRKKIKELEKRIWVCLNFLVL